MRLQPGTTFGVYEIHALVGAGGMGEVYRATDSRLRRTVALKVLPERVVVDPLASARFKREAQLLAALNHPNVGSIYDLIEVDGAHALVLELVDGETLADRVTRGPLAVEEAVAIARQVADALDSAHRRGIVHRDLKPSNIALTPNGVVKLLDFGIAKALDPDNPAADGATTMTAPFVRIGTPAYMSPEQARGQQVDQRTDIWAFGCVLYEMVTGRRAFPAGAESESLSGPSSGSPALDGLPARVRPLVQRCLEADPSRRLRDIGDATLWLDAPSTPASDVRPVPRFTPRWLWPAATLVALAALVILSMKQLREPSPITRPFRFEFSPPPGVTLARGFAVSPDGRHLAFVATTKDSPSWSLWVHSFESGTSAPIPTGEAVGPWPVWSPDGRFIAIPTGRAGAVRLERVAVEGGAAQTLVPSSSIAGLGDWSDRDVILFWQSAGLMRVSASGGTPIQVTRLDPARHELGHYWPRFLPDGRHFIYLRLSASEGASGIYVGSIDARPEQQDSRRLITVRGIADYAPASDDPRGPGYLVFNREGTLFAQKFDATRIELQGDPIRVVEHVAEVDVPARAGFFNVTRGGVLTYQNASTSFGTVWWIDRKGRPVGPAVNAPLEDPRHVRLSPDGRRFAVVAAGNAWLCDLEGKPPMKLTSTGNVDTPLWAPDSQRLIYEAKEPFRLLSVRTDGSDTPQVVSPDGHYHPHGWSAEGRDLIVALNTYSPTGWDILRIPGGRANDPQPVLRTPANEGFGGASLSTDGQWLAYTSDTTGNDEIYVQPYPGPGTTVRISSKGGSNPLWSRDGRELYYLEDGTRLMAVEIGTGKPPRMLFDTAGLRLLSTSYDVARDGRFVMIRADDRPRAPTPINVITNWTVTLPR